MHLQAIATAMRGAARAKSFTRGPRVLWTDDEVARLREALARDPRPVFTKLAARFPGRSGVAIKIAAQERGLYEAPARKAHATDGEIELVLRLLRERVHLGEIVRCTGRTHRWIHKLASKAGVEVTIGTPAERPAKAGRADGAKPAAKIARPARPKAAAVARAVPDRARKAASPPARVEEVAARAPVRTISPAETAEARELARLVAPKQPTATSKSRTTTFGRGFGRPGVKVERTADLTSMIEAFVAARGVTRIESDPVTAATDALRRRGYVVLRDGEGFTVDHKVRISGPGDLVAYARERGLAA